MHRLVQHPGEAADGLLLGAALDAGADDRWCARYVLTGPLDRVLLPVPAAPERRDGLWRHSCFELFAMAPDGGSLECNFAPSRAWAAYRFDAYRAGMRDADDIGAVAIAIEPAAPDRLVLEARFGIAWPVPAPVLRIGLSAVIAFADGTRSHHALAHPPGAPDFHHRDCFAIEVAAPPPP